MKLLIMGLPGSGKTTLARILAERFLMPHVNADTLREFYNDWDFSKEGRLMQAHRMSQFHFGILDFVCPLEQTRNIVDADFIVWMDTIDNSRFEDTDIIFEKPTKYDIRVTEHICLDTLKTSLKKYDTGVKNLTEYLDVARRMATLLPA